MRKFVRNAVNKVVMKSVGLSEKKQKGVTSLEYIIIAAILAVVIFAGWNIMGDSITAKIGEITGKLNETRIK